MAQMTETLQRIISLGMSSIQNRASKIVPLFTFINTKGDIFGGHFLLLLKNGTRFLCFIFLAQIADNNN